MRFISYAQNFEDVMLWRALKHVKSGFYIDIGANDYVWDSVTKAFYDRDWCGINVEPLRSHYDELQKMRPRDINLCCAVGASAGIIELWETDVRGWATADKAIIQKHMDAGHYGEFRSVPVTTLAMLCETNSVENIHFLKVDVEGLEEDVLLGADFVRYRPWIVVVEATKPDSTVEAHDEWEAILVDASYKFAYADGLNRFYVAKEHQELLGAFTYPPNVFDQFVRWEQVLYEMRAKDAEEKLQHAENQANHGDIRIQQANIVVEQPLLNTLHGQQNQDQIEQVLKVVEEVRIHAARIDQEYEDRINEALKVAEEARLQTIRIDQDLTERTRRALQIAEEARDIAIQANQQFSIHMQGTLKAIEEVKKKTNQLEIANDEKIQDAQRMAEQALTSAKEVNLESSLAQALIHSRSWRITAPLRWCSYQVRRLNQDGPVCRVKAALRKFYLPHIMRRLLRKLLNRLGHVNSCVLTADIGSLSDLTPAAEEFYRTLKIAVDARKKGKTNAYFD